MLKNIYICCMPRNEELQQEKRQSILNFFRELDAAEEFGVKKYTTSYCMAKTARRFFLSSRSIERYIYG